MNKKTCRLAYSRFRGMVVAVEETAAASGKTASGECRAGRRALGGSGRLIAAASLAGAPSLALTPGTSTHLIQTQNGLPEVNIGKPAGARVSVNIYNRFDVQKNGTILNNSQILVNTQQAG